MGPVVSALQCMNRILFSGSALLYEEEPIVFMRMDDYAITGYLRDGIANRWTQGLNTMIFLGLNTRRLLWSLVQKRMDRTEDSLKYTNSDLAALKVRFSNWDDKRIFQVHDLFQAFEVDGDGLIEIGEMSVGLDNLGDKTTLKDRILQLCSGDEDGTGSIDFEEFLQILYHQQEVQHSETPLAKAFVNVNNDVKFIRWMSTVQQIRSGFL